MLSPPSPVLARPTYSSISFGGSPAAATRRGSPISSGMAASIAHRSRTRRSLGGAGHRELCSRHLAGGPEAVIVASGNPDPGGSPALAADSPGLTATATGADAGGEAAGPVPAAGPWLA